MSRNKSRPPTRVAADQLDRIKKILGMPQKERRASVIGPTRAPKHYTERGQ